jgi:hypothetical protein
LPYTASRARRRCGQLAIREECKPLDGKMEGCLKWAANVWIVRRNVAPGWRWLVCAGWLAGWWGGWLTRGAVRAQHLFDFKGAHGRGQTG